MRRRRSSVTVSGYHRRAREKEYGDPRVQAVCFATRFGVQALGDDFGWF